MVLLTRETTMPRDSYARRIVADIRARIESGELRPGARLPTQRQLREQYGCSENPVKRAVDMLEAAGLIETHQGKGMWVAGAEPED